MQHFDIHTVDSAPAKARNLLEKVKSKFGFLPNILGELASSPATLEGYMSLTHLLERSSFSPTEVQALYLAISQENQCHYCVAAHSTVLRSMSRIDDETIDNMRAGKSLKDKKLDELVRFARALVVSRGYVGDRELKAFIEAGYRKSQVLEVIMAVAAKTITNYTNHITETPVDEAFKEEIGH